MSKTKSPRVKEETLAFPTVKAAAHEAGMSRQTFVKYLDQIPHRRAGRRIIITRTALQRWLEGYDMQEAA